MSIINKINKTPAMTMQIEYVEYLLNETFIMKAADTKSTYKNGSDCKFSLGISRVIHLTLMNNREHQDTLILYQLYSAQKMKCHV